MRELENRLMKHIDLLMERYPSLESAKDDIVAAYLLLEESYKNGGKLLVAGNGGSAADAEHIVGELMKGFKLPWQKTCREHFLLLHWMVILLCLQPI